MKVYELIKQLKRQDPNFEIVLSHLYTNPRVVMKKIRVYQQDGRVVMDGYEQEPKKRGRF